MLFDWVTPAIALGGRLPAGAEATLATQGLAAVIDLRQEDCDDAVALAKAGIAFLHLPTPDHHPPAIVDLDRGVKFAREWVRQDRRVLVHCEHGIGRSAILTLCILVELGVPPLQALRQAKDAREAVSPSPMQFEGWSAWLASRHLTPPSFDAFSGIAYRHLART